MTAGLCWPAKSLDEIEGGRALQCLMLTVVVLACVLSYGPMLQQFFTGTDTITLIETSRIKQVQDIQRIITQPLMAGSDFLQIARFYRPLSAVSYSMDYWLWGMNPTGFHLTNLLLHTLTCIFTFVMMRSSFGLTTLSAGIGAITFAIHPILVETVPSLDRRHDMIAGLLILLCVMCCAEYLRSQNQGRRYLWLSMTFQIGAMASKETAFFLPALILVFVNLFTQGGNALSRGRTVLQVWCPYIISAFLYLVWRSYVLGGIGGYSATAQGSWMDRGHYVSQMAVSYLYDILSPIDSMWQPALTGTGSIAVLGAVLVVLPLATECLLGREQSAELPTHTFELYKIRVFFLWWLLLPLGIYSLTLTFGHRGMYIPTIALSCLLGLNFQDISPRIRERRLLVKEKTLSWDGRRFLAELPKKVAVAVSLCAVCLMVRYSPLVYNYGAWQASAELSSNLLRQFLISTSILPDKSCVFVNQVPDSLADAPDESPQPKEVAFPRNYSFTSWLKLYLPRSHAHVIFGKRSKAKYFSGLVRLSNCLWTKSTLVVFVAMGRTNKVR